MMKTELSSQKLSMGLVRNAIEAQRPFAMVAIGLAILYTVGSALWSSALPPSYWMQISLVHVNDAKVGQSPIMQEEIKVHRTVLAMRTATVLKKQENGSMARICSSRHWNTYSAGYGPPDAFDLDWWTRPVKCDLTPGEYIVQTSWYLRPSGHYRKELHVSSNSFKVTP